MSAELLLPNGRTERVHGGVLRALWELTKPSINVMVLVTAVGGIWLSPTRPAISTLMFALLGTCLIVGSANTLNCYLEREVDKHMTRTRTRPLPAGRLAAKWALLWGATLAVVSLPILYFLVNPLTALLGAIALISYVWVYTPMKRISAYALWVGAVPGAMPPLMGWTAARGELETPGLILFLILFLWQLPHFLAIACFRQKEYEQAGIVVYPSVFGTRNSMQSGLIHAAALVPVTLLLVPLHVLGWFYAASALVLGLSFAVVCGIAITKHAETGWQRRVFFVSLMYLPALIAAIVIDVLLA